MKTRYGGGYDPFIHARPVEQVSYIPYPTTKWQKSYLWVVIKSRLCLLDVPLVDFPFQENVDIVKTSMIDIDIEDIGSLMHESGDYERVDICKINNFEDENEERKWGRMVVWWWNK